MMCRHHNHARLSYITIPLGLGWSSSYIGKHINVNKINTKNGLIENIGFELFLLI